MEFDLLNRIGITHRFRDPIYGFIWLTELELRIVDTPIFQRLRRIHQLALTKYVYPTAEHSRFGHSIGVLQSATNIFIELIKNNPLEVFSKDKKEEDVIELLKILRFAALLHDIGHLPFSHAAEKAFLPDGIAHEHVSKFIIIHYKDIASAIIEAGVNPKVVGSLLIGKSIRKYEILKKIISGEFDADRADYLLRDSYFCGVKYGEYDYIRYVQSFNLREEDGELTLHINEKNVPVIEAFLFARYQYNIQVPFHRTRGGYDLALRAYIWSLDSKEHSHKFVQVNEDNEIILIDFNYFEDFDDYHLFELIKRDSRAGNKWADILLRKDHLSPVLDCDRPKKNGEDDRKVKRFITKLIDNDFIENSHFFRYRQPVKLTKLIKTVDERDNTSLQMDKRVWVINNAGDKIMPFVEYSIFSSFAGRPDDILRIYVISERKQMAREILKHLENELGRESEI